MMEHFLEYVQIEKRYSLHTVTSYRRDLEDFVLFLNDVEGIKDVKIANKKNIRDFIIHLSENNISKRSINRKLSTLRSFYNFLLRIQEIDKFPLEGIDSLKFYSKKQVPISVDEMENLATIMDKDYPNDVLGKLIIEILYQTGMRRAELCNLSLENVDIQKRELLVLGKGRKERIIPVSKKLAGELQQYIEKTRCKKTSSHCLLVREDGKKVSEKFVYSQVNNYLSLVTSKQKISPHILRHSFATHILDNGAEISKVKKLMGHSSLASTQVYTEASIEQLRKVFNKAHPRGDDKKEKL